MKLGSCKKGGEPEEETKEMRTKSKARPKPRGIRVASKMPEIEFNMRAIRAIQKRKHRVGGGRSKRSRRKGR